MGSASRYWRLVRIDATGRRRVEEVAIAHAFFHQHFAEFADQQDVPDPLLQKELLRQSQSPATEEVEAAEGAIACLRCFISQQIEQVCVQLEIRFGAQHGFTRSNLFPFVLTDDGRSPLRSGQFQSLASEVLQTFDPTRASLGTWTARLVRHHRELNAFLLEHGVYLVSDWAILNDTTPKQLQRILPEFHALTAREVEQAMDLLQSYHAIYRQDRLQQRMTGAGRGQCSSPTTEQLARMGQFLQQQTELRFSTEAILSKLQTLAFQLRQYRIYVRGGAALTQSLDQPDTSMRVREFSAPTVDEAQEEHNEFLTFYRAQLVQGLEQAIAQVVGDRATYLQRRKPPADQKFLTALHLFHCQGRAMGEIAAAVGLKAQFEVSRLLKLKEFRADVRQRLLLLLRDRVLEKARDYTDPQRLQTLDQQVEAALDEQISTLIQQAESEAAVAKHTPLRSLFSRHLCQHLQSRSHAS